MKNNKIQASHKKTAKFPIGLRGIPKEQITMLSF
jgi:hypothetical protein